MAQPVEIADGEGMKGGKIRELTGQDDVLQALEDFQAVWRLPVLWQTVIGPHDSLVSSIFLE